MQLDVNGFLFIATSLLTVLLFIWAVPGKKTSLLFEIGLWAAIVGVFAYKGFFMDFEARPPRFMFLVLPGVLAIVILLSTKSGRLFLDKLDLKRLTILHVIRIPVEIVLLTLFLQEKIPQVMTFEGANFDILSGLSAPLMYYLVFRIQKVGDKGLLVWNFICLALVLTIVCIAILSLPMPFQQFGMEQPNIAVAFFPYVWLPAIVVPLVFLSHVAAIRQLTRSNKGLIA